MQLHSLSLAPVCEGYRGSCGLKEVEACFRAAVVAPGYGNIRAMRLDQIWSWGILSVDRISRRCLYMRTMCAYAF